MQSSQKMKVTSQVVEEVTMTRQELQKIVDVYFDVISATMHQIIDHGITKEKFYEKSGRDEGGLREAYMFNAAKHLKSLCGIETKPIGMSWGVITDIKQND